MLPKAEIARLVASSAIEIDPFSGIQLKGASYVLRLGRRYRRWLPGQSAVRMWSPSAAATALDTPEDADVFTISPGSLVLGCTLERIRLPESIAGQISPLSHVARFGLGVTCGADFINPGFGGAAASLLTLELYNHNSRPLELRSGMPVAHLRLIETGASAGDGTPRSIYEGVDPLTEPLLFEEWSPVLSLEVDNAE
jgi:dCTP deaminase